jgi:hypothetical protein
LPDSSASPGYEQKSESANRPLEQIATQTDTVEGDEVANSGHIGAAADREKIESEINLIQTNPSACFSFLQQPI